MEVGKWAALVAALVVVALALASAPALAAGPDLFVTNQGDSNLTAGGTANLAGFTIGATGGLSALSGSPFTLPGTSYPYGPAVTPDDRTLYVGDQNSNIYPFTLGTGTATIGSPVSTGSGSGPAINLVTPSGQRLYVLGVSGKVYGFAIGSGGSLTALPQSPYTVGVGTVSAMAMTPDGSHLYVAGFNSSPNHLEAFTVAADGALTEDGTSLYSIGEFSDGIRITPNGSDMYITSQDSTTPISIFAIHSDGTLTAVTPPALPSATPASPPAISADGSRLYFAASGSGVFGYSIGATGTLSPLTGSPFAGVTTSGEIPWDVELTPDGRELYAVYSPSSTASDGEIATFDVAAGGALTMRSGTVDSGGTEPYQGAMTISPDPGPTAGLAVSPGLAGQPSMFNGSTSHASDAIYGTLTYDWSFGDGSSAQNAGPTPKHVYTKPGTYDVTLTVIDAAGCSTALVWTGANSFCAADSAASGSVTVKVAPATATTSSTFDNQRITITAPASGACTAHGQKLVVKLTSAAIKGSHATKLKFASAALYLDKGVKHVHKVDHKKLVSYQPNATERHVPVTVSLSIGSLKPGTHTLRVKLSYKRTGRKHGKRVTITVTKTVKLTFKICA